MGQFDATKGKQALEIRSSLSERRALTDPILPGDSADLAHAHSRQWAKAHGETHSHKKSLNIYHHRFCLLIREPHTRSSVTLIHPIVPVVGRGINQCAACCSRASRDHVPGL